MTIEDTLLQNEKLIFETFKTTNFISKSSDHSDPLAYKEVCLDKTKDKNYYKIYWDMYIFKQPLDNKSVFNNVMFKNKIKNNMESISSEVKQIFLSPEIYQIFYFEVWGEVLEHIDFNGYKLGYKTKNYNTLLMPIQIPNTDKFKTFYDKKEYFMIEGKFMKWNVCGVSHSWEYPPSKDNKLFKLLHIDYQ